MTDQVGDTHSYSNVQRQINEERRKNQTVHDKNREIYFREQEDLPLRRSDDKSEVPDKIGYHRRFDKLKGIVR